MKLFENREHIAVADLMNKKFGSWLRKKIKVQDSIFTWRTY